jgi:hypothetical protein
MNMKTNKVKTQQVSLANPTYITNAQAVRLIEALVLNFGTQCFSATGVLAHRSMVSFKCISQFMFDELEAGVKIALSMAVKETSGVSVMPGALLYEVKQLFGDVQKPIIFKIGNGQNCRFDPSTL